jgi:hypothetical protein
MGEIDFRKQALFLSRFTEVTDRTAQTRTAFPNGSTFIVVADRGDLVRRKRLKTVSIFPTGLPQRGYRRSGVTKKIDSR